MLVGEIDGSLMEFCFSVELGLGSPTVLQQ
jgi:hypothetical protein